MCPKVYYDNIYSTLGRETKKVHKIGFTTPDAHATNEGVMLKSRFQTSKLPLTKS